MRKVDAQHESAHASEAQCDFLHSVATNPAISTYKKL